MSLHHNRNERLEGLVRSASGLREALFGRFGRETDTDAYRLMNAEGDGVPGVTVDAYAGFLTLQVVERQGLAAAGDLEQALEDVLQPHGIVRKPRYEQEERGRLRGEAIRGQPPPPALTVRERGMHFEVELLGGFHTGLFTDMRDEHDRLRVLARGRRVLNTFAYTGAFSVAAALGGAAQVTSVDVVPKVLEWARRNFRRNGLDPEDHRFARMEVLEYLGMAKRKGWSFGAIVLDPPTFATFRGGRWSAKSDYPELLRLAIDVLEPDGLLWAAVNTESLPAERFEKLIARAFESAGRDARMLAAGGLPLDFPTPAGDPSTRYLKVHVLRAG